MNVRELAKKIFATKKIAIIIICTLLVIVVGICGYMYLNNDEATADVTHMNQLLSESSELTTAKLTITAMSEFKDEGIKFLNRSDFIMVYEATVRAGINVDEVDIKANDSQKVIYITIPKAEVQEAKVEPSTIKYFDTKFSLLNTNEKEDANKAQTLAEERAKEEAAKTGILQLANSQAKTLITGILANAIPEDYEIKVK